MCNKRLEKSKKKKIVNRFSMFSFNEATLELFKDNDADTEFAGLQNYIPEISPVLTINSYLNQDKYEITSVNMVDICSMNQREDLRAKTIRCVIEDDSETEKQAEADDNFDIERRELKIQSSQAVLSIADDWNSFCKILGDVDLVSALNLLAMALTTYT